MRSGTDEKDKMDFESTLTNTKKSFKEGGRNDQFGRLTKLQFVSLGQEDIQEVEKEMYREKIYHKFLNNPFDMEKNIIKLVKKSKTNKPKHVAKAQKIIDAMTALSNDSQRLLRYDVRHLFWKILIENYEFTPQ